MCSVFLCTLLVLWKKSQITPFFLFILVFSFLFVGGRFWAFLISPDEQLFDIQAGTFFLRESIPDEHFVVTLCYVICFVIFAVLGYTLKKSSNNVQKSFEYSKISEFLNIMFWPLALFSIAGKVLDFFYALENGGYLAMYEGQTESYSSFSSLGDIFLFVFWGMAFTFGKENVRKKYLILLLFYSVIRILIGARGTFGSFMMFILWLYSQRHKINIVKLSILGALAVVLLLFVFSFSIRAVGADDVSGANVFSAFLYKQGITLAVFDQSRDLTNYPIAGYFQNFIPGSSFIYSHLINPNAYPYELTFDGYLSYSLNESEYSIGHGLGWSFMGDLYIYSMGNILLFSLFAYIFGHICAYVENKSYEHPYYKLIVYAIFFRFMIFPRAGLNTIIPFIWYVTIIYLIITILSGFKMSKVNIQYSKKENLK